MAKTSPGGPPSRRGGRFRAVDPFDADLRARPGWRRTALVVAIAVGAVAVAWGGMRILSWRATRAREARQARAARYDREAAALRPSIDARLARVAAATDGAADAPASCPAAAAGASIPLVHRPSLAWLNSGADLSHRPATRWSLESPAFAYLDYTVTPALDDERTYQDRNAALAALAGAPVIAVLVPDAVHDVDLHGATFDGGDVSGRLILVDADRGAALCATRVASQPGLVLGVRQDSADAERAARASAAGHAMAASFWDAADQAVAAMAGAGRDAGAPDRALTRAPPYPAPPPGVPSRDALALVRADWLRGVRS